MKIKQNTVFRIQFEQMWLYVQEVQQNQQDQEGHPHRGHPAEQQKRLSVTYWCCFYYVLFFSCLFVLT